jgi:penicillin-binding protein 1A
MIVVAAATLSLAVAAAFIGAYYYLVPGLPLAEDLRDIDIGVPLQIYSRDGRLIEEFGEVKRQPIDYADVPPLLVKAVLAAEDEHFFEHPGIDFRGVIRALLSELGLTDVNSGGSTITQQIPRNLDVFARAGTLSGLERFVQKYREILLAFRIEREFSKPEILELFLNTNFYGHASYGVVTAAHTYFGKELGDLDISEVAILAGIPQRPSVWNPVSSVQGTMGRRAYVLRRMRETGAIDPAQEEAALAEPIVAKQHGSQRQLEAPYVAEMARAWMLQRFGPAAYTAGFKVTTTVDSRLQRAANRAIRDTLTAYDERHGYRGPLAHVDLPAGTQDGSAAPDTAPDPAALRAVLDDYVSVIELETAVVTAVEPLAARVFFAASGEQTIGFEAVSWAVPYVDDSIVGNKPEEIGDVLKPGDVVRFRRDANGQWRLAQVPEVQGAFVSVDSRDGAVVALTGGLDYSLSKYNRATQAQRQPGSSFKPFVYSAALESGFTPASIINDAPPNIGYQASLEREWKPANFNDEYFGEVRLRFALRKSLNSVSIKLVQAMGVPETIQYLKRFGFDGVNIPNDLSLALGAGGVAPLELVRGYATFANGGYRVDPYFIDRITMADGTELFTATPAIACPDCAESAVSAETPTATVARPMTPVPGAAVQAPDLITDVTQLYPPLREAPRVISPQNAYLMTDLLQDVVDSGTGNRAKRELGRSDLGGKTGTTNEGRDTWFVGFNGDVTGAAWVGFEDNRPLGGNEQGGVTAIPMWIGYMHEALAGMPEHVLARPPGIVEYRINPINGLIANDAARDTIFEKFEVGKLPDRELEPDFDFEQRGPDGVQDLPKPDLFE